MNLSPETLTEESNEERQQRQARTGVLGTGLTVHCTPTGDPEVFEVKSRVVCLVRPYDHCSRCSHSLFTLSFNADPTARFEQVQCPRWRSISDRLKGEDPDSYVPVEVALCGRKPFEFCASCPLREDLAQLDVDKSKSGWYSRWKRFTKEEEDDS